MQKKREESVKKVQKIVRKGDNFYHDMVTVTNYVIKYKGPQNINYGLALSLGPRHQPMTIQIFIGLILRPETG